MNRVWKDLLLAFGKRFKHYFVRLMFERKKRMEYNGQKLAKGRILSSMCWLFFVLSFAWQHSLCKMVEAKWDGYL